MGEIKKNSPIDFLVKEGRLKITKSRTLIHSRSAYLSKFELSCIAMKSIYFLEPVEYDMYE